MKRVFARKKKNYLWLPRASTGSFNSSTVAEAVLSEGAGIDNTTGFSRKEWNLQRVVGEFTVGVNLDDLGETGPFLVCGPVSWGIYIRDFDDPTAYDPAVEDFGKELVLAWGLTDRIGYGNTDPVGGAPAQSAAFNANVTVHFDIRTNRRFTSDSVLAIAFTRDATTALSTNTNNPYIVKVISRVLHKFP